MNKTISLNVAIIPSSTVIKEAIMVSNKIAKICRADIILNNKERLPHISVYQACYPLANLPTIKNILEHLLTNFSQFVLNMNGFSSNLDTYLFWLCRKNTILQKLHNQVVNKLNALREGLVLPHLTRVTGMEKEDIGDIRKYGNIYIGERYKPHITLSRLSQKQESSKLFNLIGRRKDINFTVDGLVLGKVGEGGTLTEIIERFSF